VYVINVNLELANNKIVKITIIFSDVNLFLQKSHGDKLYSILYLMQLNLCKYINNKTGITGEGILI